MYEYPPEPPRIPGYNNFQLIGTGGFARVWFAQDLTLHRDVAVKVLHQPLDDDARERFRREMQITAQFSEHPGIVPIHYASLDTNGLPFAVMRYMAKGSLSEALKTNGPVSPSSALDLLSDACNLLTQLHSGRFLHRDVRPPNLLLSDDGLKLRLTDFGIVRVLSENRLTADDAIVGSYTHISPEVATRSEPRGLSESPYII